MKQIVGLTTKGELCVMTPLYVRIEADEIVSSNEAWSMHVSVLPPKPSAYVLEYKGCKNGALITVRMAKKYVEQLGEL